MKSLKSIITETIKEYLKENDYGYSNWKRKNVTLRGIKELGKTNEFYGTFGNGLYTVPLSNKAMAKQYGDVYFVVYAKPKKPKVLDNLNLAEMWIQKIVNDFCKKHGEKYSRTFFENNTTIEDEMLNMGYDGLVIKGREMVNYTPSENVRFFENERQLIQYYEHFVVDSKANNSLKEQKILKEYINREEVSLKDYLSMSESEKKAYLPHDYYYFFEDFLIEVDPDFEMPTETIQTNYADEPEEEVDMFEKNDYELIEWLENNDKETYDKFAQYLYKKITYHDLPINDAEYPAWSFFGDSPEVIKNQWLIHFTNNADKLAMEGFKYGVDDIDKLGLTTHLGEFDKKYGGYNFAYLLSDFPRYAKGRHGYKYGDEDVIFNASGIRVWHLGDEEYQVNFYGNTAKNIIPITNGENANFAIYNKKGRVLYENDDLPKVVNWLVKNYQQYRKNIF